jgi:hypothetical protein
MFKQTALIAVAVTLAGCDELAKSQMHSIENQVAQDAVNQYEIAAREGDPMQKCVQAGMVSAAYLQAEDESNYKLWKATEKADCAVAGVPR